MARHDERRHNDGYDHDDVGWFIVGGDLGISHLIGKIQVEPSFA